MRYRIPSHPSHFCVFTLLLTLSLTLFCQAAEERGVDVKALGAESTLATPTSPCSVTVEHPAERALVFELMQLGDVLHHVLQELLPNRLCDYLKEVHILSIQHDLSLQLVNTYYQCDLSSIHPITHHTRSLDPINLPSLNPITHSHPPPSLPSSLPLYQQTTTPQVSVKFTDFVTKCHVLNVEAPLMQVI